MASMYVARLKNARRIGNKLKKYLREGYLVFDEDSYQIKKVTYKLCYGHIWMLINGSFIYMDSNPEMANGMEMTIKEFNDQFKNWVIVHPKHVQQLEA